MECTQRIASWLNNYINIIISYIKNIISNKFCFVNILSIFSQYKFIKNAPETVWYTWITETTEHTEVGKYNRHRNNKKQSTEK